MKLIPAITLVGMLAISACNLVSDPANGVVCTRDFRYGLTVHVVDSLTNTSAAAGAKLVIREGTFVDSATTVFPGSTDALVSAGERAGTYTVTVSKAGYKDWVKAGVVITKDECHVIGVSLTAKLQKL